jgi:hypothetical protein
MQAADARLIDAVHESGHAVAAHRHTIPIIRVTIEDGHPHLHRGCYRFSPRSSARGSSPS